MKIIASLSIVLLAFSFSSCRSIKDMSVPGESRLVRRNIDEEYFAIAETYKSQENYSKAVSYYEKVLLNEALHDSAYYEIALCNVYLKKWDEARKSFITILKRDTDNMSLKLCLAYIEAMRGDLEKAEDMYARICTEYPDELEPMQNYINILIAMEKYEAAKEKLAELIEKYPDDEKIVALDKKIKELTEDSETKTEEEAGDDKSVSDEELFGLNEEEKKSDDDTNKENKETAASVEVKK